MTTYAPTGAPSWSRRVWADSEAIYLEIPSREGPPLIQRYSKSDSGLAKALELICLAFHREAPKPGRYKIIEQANIKKVGINNFSTEQRAKAAEVLKKLKIT